MLRRIPIVLLVWALCATGAQAQLSGSSFGGSRGFGGGSSSSSSSSSSFGGGSSFGSSSSSSSDYLDRQRERQEAERRRREAEEARRRAEEERRRAEEARRRAEEEARQRLLAADRSLPPAERAALARRFGDRLERPEPPGSSPDIGHVPAASLEGEEPVSNEVAMPRIYSRSVRVVPNWSEGGVAGLFGGVVLLLIVFGVVATRRRRAAYMDLRMEGGAGTAHRPAPPARARPGRPRGRSSGSCEIRRISIAFDWSERARIQQALERMAGKYDMRSASGMHGAASEAAQLLVEALPAARYGMFQRYLETTQRAERRFFDLAQDLKSRFRHDVRRGGQREFQAKAEEGEGLVVVSFVVGATRHLGPMASTLDRAAIARLLQAAVRISPQELVALEVVWSPAAEMDRMSSLELETVYPELMPLDSGSLGGISCGYCGAVHAAELPECPACGAPR